MDDEIFEVDGFSLTSGESLSRARIAFRTYGQLNRDRSNAIILCSPVASGTETYEFLIGDDKALNPSKYFIISTALFGSGVSSSPSNAAAIQSGPDFPVVTIADNVAAQKLLIEQRWNLSSVLAVCGFSMGAQQAFQWGVSYSKQVEKIIAWCGHACTTPYTEIFLDGVAAALKASPDWRAGQYASPPRLGLKAMSRAYAGWGMSAGWYREEGWRTLGCNTKEAFLEEVLDEFFYQRDANDLLSQFETWKSHNVGAASVFDGDHLAALATVRASVLVMPCDTDLYFPVEDSIRECNAIADARLAIIESNWGHWAGFGIDPGNAKFLNSTIAQHLSI